MLLKEFTFRFYYCQETYLNVKRGRTRGSKNYMSGGNALRAWFVKKKTLRTLGIIDVK
jgi:hypothetical protein